MSRILLADTNPTTRKVVELTFAQEDIEVVSFADGEAALQYLNDHTVDVVLADVSLPRVDGYEICRQVKQGGLNAVVPVVLLVGRFEPFFRDRAEAVGYHCQLSKPFETTTLVEMVLQLTARPDPSPPRRDLNRFAVDSASDSARAPERSDAMLFKLPISSQRQDVVFTLSEDQCRPQPQALRRETIGHRTQRPVPDNGDETPEAVPAAEVEPPPVQEVMPDRPERLEAAQESSEPSESSAPREQVDQVMSKLVDRLPDVIRAILAEDKK